MRGAWIIRNGHGKAANVAETMSNFMIATVTFYPCSGCTWKCESNENGAEIANGNYVTISDAENGSVSHGKVVGGMEAQLQYKSMEATPKNSLAKPGEDTEPAMPLPARGANKKKFPLMQVFVNAVCRETLEQIDKRECHTTHCVWPPPNTRPPRLTFVTQPLRPICRY